FGEAEARAAGRRFQEVAFEARGLGLGDVAARVAVDQFVFDGEEVFEEGVVGEVARLKLLLLGRGHLAQKVVDDSLSLVAWLCHGPSAFSAISLLLSVANDDHGYSVSQGVRLAQALAELAFEPLADAVRPDAQGVGRNAQALGQLPAAADALAPVAAVVVEDQLAA